MRWKPFPCGFICPHCGNAFMFYPNKPPDECPVCGAKMNE